jgi:cellobiose phosphorylase
LEGLRIRPCLPPSWRSARVRREFRGAAYDIRIQRDAKRPAGFLEVSFNGRRLSGDLLPAAFDRKNEVVVIVGKAK